MKRLIVYAKRLIALGLITAVLTACQNNDPLPPTQLAAVATATNQPSPRPTIAVTETAVPTSTLQPTLTRPEPTPTFTPLPDGLIPEVSSQGQLAFVQNQVLFVETAVGSGTFNEFGSNIGYPLWSPRGDRLIFRTCAVPDQIYCEEPTWMLFDLKINSLVRLDDLIPTLPSGDFGVPTWMRRGEKLLFRILFEGDISILDLETSSFSTPIQGSNNLGTWELPDENLLIQDHFGIWANVLQVYDLNGIKIWSFPNPNPLFPEFRSVEGVNAGVLEFSEAGQLLIIFEPDENLDEFAAFYYFDPVSFEIEHLFSYQLAPATSLQISPDGQLIAMYVPRENGQNEFEDKVLIIVDQNGRSYGQRPNSFIVDWRPGGGPVVQESMADGQIQLVYWPLDGSAVQVFVSPGSFEFGSGKWSGDGRFFIYSTVNEAANQSHLYLWQPENGVRVLLQTAVGSDGFRNFAWLPDSTGVYFNFGQMELWKFAVEIETLILIASSAENE